MSTTTDTATLDEIIHDAAHNWPLIVWRLARVAGLTLDDLDAALGKPVALELLSGRRTATISQFAALAHAVGRRGSDVLQEAQDLPIDWHPVEQGGQILTAVGQLDPHAAAWLASQSADLPDVIGLQPVVNASGRFIGERWGLSVDAAAEFVTPPATPWCPSWCCQHEDADPGQQFHAGREFVPIAPSLHLEQAKALVVIPIVPVGEDVQQWAIDEGKAGGWIDVCTAEPWGDVFCALGVREARAFAAALVRAADQIELGAVDPK